MGKKIVKRYISHRNLLATVNTERLQMESIWLDPDSLLERCELKKFYKLFLLKIAEVVGISYCVLALF